MELITVSAVNPLSTKPGGTRTYVMNLINSMLTYDINVTLIGISNNKAQVGHEFKFVNIIHKNNVSSYNFLINLLLKTPFLKITKSSIIHAHRPDTMLPFVLFFRKNVKVCTLHGLAHDGIVFKKGAYIGKFYHYIEEYTLKHTDAVIAVSDETKDVYLQIYPWLKDKLIVIPVGIDEKFRPLDKNKLRKKYGFNVDDKIILYVGRFEKEKRLDILLRAFKELKTDTKNAKLILVGDGRERYNVKMMIKKLKIEDVVLLSTIEHNQMPEILNCADVLVLTSLYEGMPTVVLEALACGVPVVSTDVGDVHKVVKNGDTGYIIKSDNYHEIKNGIFDIISNNNSFKDNCISVAQNYNWKTISKKIIKVYATCQR